jgi:hypothetical protein
VIAHKSPQATTGYQNVNQLLAEFQAEHEVIEHEPVLSMEDVKRAVDVLPKCILKTLLIRHQKTDEFVAIVIQSDKHLNMQQVAQLLQVNRHHINFAAEKEIQKLGFPLGGIAPFGFEPEVRITKFVDMAIVNYRCKWLYMGMGDNRKTLKIRKADFLKMIADYQKVDF